MAIEDRLVGNAIHVYLLMRRLVDYLPHALESKEIQEEAQLDDYVKEISELKATLKVPNENDLQLSMLSLARIQHIYQLPVQDLSTGLIGSRQTLANLHSYDCQEIAESRISQKFPLVPTSTEKEYALAIEWSEVAFE